MDVRVSYLLRCSFILIFTDQHFTVLLFMYPKQYTIVKKDCKHNTYIHGSVQYFLYLTHFRQYQIKKNKHNTVTQSQATVLMIH